MTRFRLAATAGSLALSIGLSASPALAQIDGQQIVERMVGQLNAQGLTASAEGVSVSGDDITIATLTIAPAADIDALVFEDTVLEDVAETQDGSYRVGRIAIPAMEHADDDVTVSFEGGAIIGYTIAGPEVTDPVLRGNLYESFLMDGLTVSDEDGPVFSMDSARASMSPYAPGETMQYDMEVAGMVADMSTLDDAQARQTMAALGYETLRGSMQGTGSWNAETGRMTLDPVTISVDDAAELTMRMDFSGYTAELIGALQDMQRQMDEQNMDAMNMAMLGLMQQLEVNAISFSLDDRSLTNRIVDFVAAQQGVDRAGVVAMAKGMLPLGLAQLRAPEFAAEVTAAVGTFLENPQSLTISADPENAVPMAQLTAAAMSSPQTLIDILRVSVTANQ
ncbi:MULTISPECIES: hypothetical protein [unclassified Roseitalea]|uniref:hypothetical protein n=1 Tax=unclassified Roseitalea TaxID=2639107 RepID=UPI00273EB9A7|nr:MULTISPECIES: hypothetical protein [unclassified Roseitalea]